LTISAFIRVHPRLQAAQLDPQQAVLLRSA
jgi:hypothetical protein